MLCLLGSTGALSDGAPPDQPGGQIVVTIDEITNPSGSILCKLFTTAEEFPVGKPAVLLVVPVDPKKETVCTFARPPRGRVAVAVAHDLDGNGELTRNFVGIPKEPFGFSNGAKASMFGPPKFRDASFMSTGAPLAMRIPLEQP